jgi:hypothetical protein
LSPYEDDEWGESYNAPLGAIFLSKHWIAAKGISRFYLFYDTGWIVDTIKVNLLPGFVLNSHKMGLPNITDIPCQKKA